MNAERQQELLAHLDKQQQRLNHGGTSSDRGGASKRKGPEVKFPQPYTRDPNQLFILQPNEAGVRQTLPAPMNNNANGHVRGEGNPVKYTKVRLACDVGQYSKGTSFEVATVDYARGDVKLFTSETDFYNGDPAFEDIFRVDGKKRYINQFYIREILEFLQRGHSLLEPECRCVHDIGSERAAELGISMPKFKTNGGPEDPSSLRTGECPLSTARMKRTSAEVAHEIAVGDLYAIVDKTGERLVDKLQNNPKIVYEDKPNTHEWAFKATYRASSKQELLQLVNSRGDRSTAAGKKQSYGFEEPSEKDTYNGVKADVQALVAAGDVYMLTNPDLNREKVNILFPRMKDLQLDVDGDLKELWKKLGKKEAESESTIRDEMRKEGLIPTKQKAAEPKVLGKRKGGPGSRRRTSKKNNANDHLRIPLGGAR